MQIVAKHSAQGVSIIEPLQSLHDVIPLVRWHHERLDGRGYPDGLRGDAIPPLVRILSVVDVYDALSSDRPYRKAIPHAECLQILAENAAGGGLDPFLVERFSEVTKPRAKVIAHPPHHLKKPAVRHLLEEIRSFA